MPYFYFLNFTSMRLMISLTLALLTATCCNQPEKLPCAVQLHAADQALLKRTDSLVQNTGAMDTVAYIAQLKTLREEEKALFDQARECDFGDDRLQYNYWHRSRLKFPSRLEQELTRLGAQDR